MATEAGERPVNWYKCDRGFCQKFVVKMTTDAEVAPGGKYAGLDEQPEMILRTKEAAARRKKLFLNEDAEREYTSSSCSSKLISHTMMQLPMRRRSRLVVMATVCMLPLQHAK